MLNIPSLSVPIPEWSDLLPPLAIIVLGYLAFRYFHPFFGMQFNKLRLLRLRWAYEAMIGRKMSVRVKHTNIGERLSAELVKMMDEGVITRKDKRELIRKIEILLQLDTGTLGTKPGQKEVKRRVRGRLSAKSAAIAEANAAVGNKVVSLAATRGKLNLANIMEKR